MIEERDPRSTATLTMFLLFAAVFFGLTPAEASFPRGGVAEDGSPSLALHELARSAIASSRFGFAGDVSLLDVEGAPGCFGFFGLETSRCERTYARNNPLKYVDPDGKFVVLAPAVVPAAAMYGSAGLLAFYVITDLTNPSRGGRSVILDTGRELVEDLSTHFSKEKGRGRDSGLTDIPTPDLEQMYKDAHGEERLRYQRELKNRRDSDKGKGKARGGDREPKKPKQEPPKKDSAEGQQDQKFERHTPDEEGFDHE